MSVYTTVVPAELEGFLHAYDLGTLVEYRGIHEGIEVPIISSPPRMANTCLRCLNPSVSRICRTIWSWWLFYPNTVCRAPHPLADRQGSYLRAFKAKPAALVQRLRGTAVTTPNIQPCRAIGAALGHLHVEGQAFTGRRDHTRGPQWRQTMAERLLPRLSAEDAVLLREEVNFQIHHYARAGLPWGVIHADLFRDNALFSGDELTGIIDFYYACNGVLLYDLAVTVNDWCIRPDSSLETAKVLAILSAYHEQRPLQESEHAVWPMLLRVAALRFWLSRLQDQFFPRAGELTQIKDPSQFRRILREHVKNYAVLDALWV